MKEFTFIRTHLSHWQQMENVVDNVDEAAPDTIAEAYTELTGDLAFAQTNYTGKRVTLYLNALCAQLHNAIYQTRREKWSRLWKFWGREVPLTMWQSRRLLLASLLIAVVGVVVGAVSQMIDPEFCRVILGDQYVDMTLQNIARGAPMAVYDSDKELSMFLGITINNVWVSFRIFASGLLTSFAVGAMLLQNLIMLGCFEVFFAQHGLLVESLLAVMLHGTLEISAIIIAGAAGLAVGNGWLMPGTYRRIDSFRLGCKRGMKIVVGTVPVFIVAGFVEGFVTRHTELPDGLRLGFIVFSLLFVVGYFVVIPYILYHKR